MKTRLELLAAILLGACSSHPTEPVEPETTSKPVSLPAIGKKPLGSLTRPETEALCREDARRFDPCLETGLGYGDEAECNAAADACHAATTNAPPEFDCRRYDLDAKGECDVSVDEYLACVDAWNVVNTCANAGKYLGPPEACHHVVSACPRYGRVFYRDGSPPACDPSTAARPPHDESEDFHGFDGCRPIPVRFVVLGDSIAACAGVAISGGDCAPVLMANHVRDTVSPGLAFESHAVSGAFIAELPSQAATVEGGPGHVAVWIQILGNDLSLRHDDPDAWYESFETTFAYFDDRSRFPDGATFLLNTQYSPYDRCPDPTGGGYSISLAQEDALQAVNQSLFIRLGEERPDAVTYDEYPSWLGHGDHANVLGCPYCGADNTGWMAFDRIHPNGAGNAHLAAAWNRELDEMYAPSCAPHDE